MISKSGVHLPDTTYGGNPIAWKDADDSDEELRRLCAENAKLQEQGERLFDKTLELGTENSKLRELVKGLQYCAHEAYGMCARTPIGGGRPFTCCPLYDFDAREYRCEKLMHELGIEVGE